MTELNVRSVDPRDIDSEVSEPTYRVYFWSRYQGSHAVRVVEVTGADNVHSVLAWADANAADDETHVVYVVIDAREDNRTLLSSDGEGPN